MDIESFKEEVQKEKSNFRKNTRNSSGTNDSKTSILPLFILVGVLIIIIGLISIVTIPTGYVGVKSYFGEAKEILPPGLHFIIPFYNGVNLINMQIVKYEVPSSAASKDLQVVTTTITVNYKVTNSNTLDIWSNFRGDHENGIIQPLTHETLKAVTSQFTASELITKRENVKSIMYSKLKENLKDYGIDVIETSLVDFQFSEQFDKAIEEKMVAEQEKLKMQQELEKTQIEVQKLIAQADAQSESKKLVADASAYQKKVEADAEAYYLQTTSQAQADAIDRIKSKISGDYLNYWYIENWDGKVPQVISSSNSGILFGMNGMNLSN
jgi:regulator of protease activity HflC (stomatin/prohibitin superfamily)